jgi:uncharacterized protein YaaW (UPF0174 family)
MPYKHDTNLDFLKTCSSADLDVLVQVLIKEVGGVFRMSENLTKSELYRKHAPNHSVYWEQIACEIQCFGANTFGTLWRGGHGVEYKEILIDVCRIMKVNFDPHSSVELIELNMLMKIMIDSMEKKTAEQLKELVAELKLDTTAFTKQAVIAAIQAGVRSSGLLAYRIAYIVANQGTRPFAALGLSLSASAEIQRTFSISAGPIGWIITALWNACAIARPAFRVTIPCVIQIAFLRLKVQNQG